MSADLRIAEAGNSIALLPVFKIAQGILFVNNYDMKNRYLLSELTLLRYPYIRKGEGMWRAVPLKRFYRNAYAIDDAGKGYLRLPVNSNVGAA